MKAKAAEERKQARASELYDLDGELAAELDESFQPYDLTPLDTPVRNPFQKKYAGQTKQLPTIGK